MHCSCSVCDDQAPEEAGNHRTRAIRRKNFTAEGSGFYISEQRDHELKVEEEQQSLLDIVGEYTSLKITRNCLAAWPNYSSVVSCPTLLSTWWTMITDSQFSNRGSSCCGHHKPGHNIHPGIMEDDETRL